MTIKIEVFRLGRSMNLANKRRGEEDREKSQGEERERVLSSSLR